MYVQNLTLDQKSFPFKPWAFFGCPCFNFVGLHHCNSQATPIFCFLCSQVALLFVGILEDWMLAPFATKLLPTSNVSATQIILNQVPFSGGSPDYPRFHSRRCCLVFEDKLIIQNTQRNSGWFDTMVKESREMNLELHTQMFVHIYIYIISWGKKYIYIYTNLMARFFDLIWTMRRTTQSV